MMKRVLALVLVTASLLSGCGGDLDLGNVDLEMVPICHPEVGAPQSEEWLIPRWGAESVDLYLQFQEPVSMDLAAADRLMRGDLELLSQFTWASNSTCLDPSVQLDVGGDKGSLTIVQGPLIFRLPEGTTPQNEWRLEVTRAISSSLTLNAGQLSGALDLTGLRLSELKMISDDTDATITFGSLNPEKLRLFEVETGNSNLTMSGLGNANFEKLTLRGGEGTYSLRFGGNWPDSAQAQIQLGGSIVDILVPTKVGLRVEMQGQPPTVDAHNLQKQAENLYISEGFEEAERSFIIRVSMTGGSLTLRWGE
jgi:hypothetical protein